MGVIFMLIIISLGIAIVFLFAFFWSAKSGQYEDSYGPSVRMLFDHDSPVTKEKDKSK